MRRQYGTARVSVNPLSIVNPSREAGRRQVFELITDAYWMELESVMRLTSCRLRRGQGKTDVVDLVERLLDDEIAHARRLVWRIAQLGGTVPEVKETVAEPLLPSAAEDAVDVVSLAVLVVRAANRALSHYERLADAARMVDPVTYELVLELLDDEGRHRDAFELLVAGRATVAA
jgi:bacterioferritin